MRGRFSALAWAVGLITAIGCGGPKHPATYPVSGTVTYRGQALADADVTFMPAKGTMASGRTDAQGHFQLTTFAPGDGAVPGEHTVLVVKKEKIVDPKKPPSPYEMTKNVLPPRYGLARESGLKAKVATEGKNEFTFALTE